MALPLLNGCESGGTAGGDETTVTAANSGDPAGNAFDDVTIGASGVLKYDTARSAHGTYSIRCEQPGTATTTRMRWSTSLGTVTELWGRCYIYQTAFPTSSWQPIRINDSAGTRLALVWPGVSADQHLY